MIGISGSLIWSKTLMELIFNSCGEFRWSPEGPVSQIHSSPPRWCPWDLFRSFKVCLDVKERGCGKQREATAPIQSLIKLQPWFLSLRLKTCLRQNCNLCSCACSERPVLGQNTLMMIMILVMYAPLMTNWIPWHILVYITFKWVGIRVNRLIRHIFFGWMVLLQISLQALSLTEQSSITLNWII